MNSRKMNQGINASMNQSTNEPMIQRINGPMNSKTMSQDEPINQ
jgi:hypothetical protein